MVVYSNFPPAQLQERGQGFRVSTREVADLLGGSEHDSVYASLFRHVQVNQLEARHGLGGVGDLQGEKVDVFLEEQCHFVKVGGFLCFFGKKNNTLC